MTVQLVGRWFFLVLLLLAGSGVWAQDAPTSVRRGNRRYGKGEHAQAEVEYRKALHADANSLKATFNLADALYSQEKYQEALDYYSNIAGSSRATSAQQSDALYNMGNAFYKLGDYQKSLEAYKQALRIDPSNAEARYNASQALRKLQQNQQSPQQQNKDQQQGQDKQNQDKQQGQDQQQGQDKQNQDKQQGQNQQPGQAGQMTQAQAAQLLQALERQGAARQGELKKALTKKAGKPVKTQKDW